MMSKEEVAEIMTYCKEKGISYKSRLAELDIPALKFYDSKSRYAKEQADSKESAGEFLQLTSGGEFVPMPSFAATTGRGFSKKKDQPQKMMSIELSEGDQKGSSSIIFVGREPQWQQLASERTPFASLTPAPPIVISVIATR